MNTFPGLSPKPTIALFSAFYPPHMGGVERFTSNLAAAIEEGGEHHVVVVTNNVPPAAAYEVQDDGAEVFRLPCKGLLGDRFPLPQSTREYDELWDELESRDYAGVFINTRFYPHSILGLELARHKGIQAVVLDHGSSHLTLDNPLLDNVVQRYEHYMTRKGLKFAPKYYGVSQESAQWLEHFGIEAQGVIHNAIDAQAFRASSSGRDFKSELGVPEGALFVAFSGRLVASKGAQVVAQAAGYFNAEQVVCAIAGDGPQREQIEQLGFENVHVLGMLEHADVASLMSQADVLCFPSTYPEGLPTVFLEAGACGAAVVTTRVGGAGEVIVDSSCGLILDSTDPVDYAGALQWYLDNPAELAAQKLALQTHIEHDFTWAETARRVIAAITQ